ncbi:MAG: MarR family transcriptional regulator [Lachnospiraceae bacterium]|nr:MarR family transcriptional regulator [Lachnospiraceae bacterium]
MESDRSQEILNGFADYIENIKELLSHELWENVFFNCTKNEVLIFWLLYRRKEAKMSEIAEYIHVPLNTATGIVGRMEKSGMVRRARSDADKRIVLVSFSESGREMFKKLMDELLSYGVKILGSLSGEERKLLESMMGKVKDVLAQKKQEEKKVEAQPQVRRIMIE